MITTEKAAGRGRPKKIISEAFLQEVFRAGRNISIRRLATSFNIHRNTIMKSMKMYGITRPPFSDISDESLDDMIKTYKQSHPNTGIRYIRGYLTQQGLRVQRKRIIDSLSRVDNIAKVILRSKTIKRREYVSSRPNALWHVDGHHKLGPWGIVIHGFVDGYDRMVRCLHCTITNQVHSLTTRLLAFVYQQEILLRRSSSCFSMLSRSMGVLPVSVGIGGQRT